MQLDSGLKC